LKRTHTLTLSLLSALQPIKAKVMPPPSHQPKPKISKPQYQDIRGRLNARYIYMKTYVC
jgi:hypothetical protein